jgi:hypothetical protein
MHVLNAFKQARGWGCCLCLKNAFVSEHWRSEESVCCGSAGVAGTDVMVARVVLWVTLSLRDCVNIHLPLPNTVCTHVRMLIGRSQ